MRNSTFPSILVESINNAAGSKNLQPPLSHTVISLSSYLLTHATSTSSPRAISYANVALHILLAFVESEEVIRAFCEPNSQPVRLCRQVSLLIFSTVSRLKISQRHPMLPFAPSPRPLICAVLDCCILWLQHNLHKRLETSLYL